MVPPREIAFEKMHGSGNDFIAIHHDEIAELVDDLPLFVHGVCRRGTSIGADGVIIIGPSEVADFGWRYMNADGTDGEMCGNGAMVGARYAVTHGLADTACSFETPVGIVRAVVDGERVSLKMMDAQRMATQLHFEAMPDTEFDFCMLGVPHVVGFVDDADMIDHLDRIGRTIRHDAQMQPHGTNVNVVHRIDSTTIRMRTYERGVEAETLACGTGAVCSAIAAHDRGLVQQPVNVKVSSGMMLTVSWRNQGESATDVQLAGTARTVSRGVILPEALS
jgi:diaminopimelate epimerase